MWSLNVRYSPNSGGIADIPGGPSRAKKRHQVGSDANTCTLTFPARLTEAVFDMFPVGGHGWCDSIERQLITDGTTSRRVHILK